MYISVFEVIYYKNLGSKIRGSFAYYGCWLALIFMQLCTVNVIRSTATCTVPNRQTNYIALYYALTYRKISQINIV